MSLKKFEDFEHNLEENDKKERAADFKSAMTELFGSIKPGQMYELPKNMYVIQRDTDEPGVVFINKGTGTPFVKVKILGFLEE